MSQHTMPQHKITLQTPTSNRPDCPKCGRTMHRQSKTPGGRERWLCRPGKVYCYSTTAPSAPQRSESGSVKAKTSFKRSIKDTTTYIITAAQNATPVHQGFLAALKVAAKDKGAELIVIPMRYKNPTSRWTASQANEETWAPELEPYLYNQRKKLNANLVLLSDVKAQPTASAPLSGFEGLTGGESSIIGHTRVQLRVVPVPAGRFPKILTTTGACTLPNYTDSKAGKLGDFHHSLAAVVVEVRGKRFYLRQIGADKDGTFTDLDKVYSATGVTQAPPALALVMGDTHARFVCPKVMKATFGPKGIVETLNPETLVWHDLLDGYSANPHHLGNPFIASAKLQAGFSNVRKEVEDTISFLDRATGNRKSVVVASNHDNFLARWVMREDWKRDPENAAFYLETAIVMLASSKMGPGGAQFNDPFRHWVAKHSTNAGVRCLSSDESLSIAGVECGMHGNQGPNGSRGSIKNLSKLGSKVIVGHSHTPSIESGSFQTGTSTPLRLEYTSGPSSWLNSHVIIYNSGKRSLLTIIDGDWRV